MEQTPRLDMPVIDGFYGVPQHIEMDHGPLPDTMEWLLNAIERHATAEADALVQYQHLADASADPVVALVMRLILDDEERHHRLLKRIEASLQDALNWSHSPAALPLPATHNEPAPADLPALARELIHEEQTGARRMRDLAHSEKGISGDLHSLLLEMMAMDSDKHAHLLRFVQQRLEARAQ
jgi:hypothetical protein